MSNGNSNDHIARLGLVLIVVVLVGIVAFQKSGYEHVNPVSNEYETSEYQKRANARVENECSGIQGVDFAKCANEIEKAARDAHRSQKDLKAQRYMALWAFFMAAAGIVGLIVTGVGLYFIYRTLVASEKATKAAVEAVNVTRDMGERQIRAYLAVENSTVRNLAVGQNMKIEFSLKNSGQSPAKNVSVETIICFTDEDPNSKKLYFGTIPAGSRAHVSAGGDYRQFRNYETTIDQSVFDNITNGTIHILFAGVIKYKDVFGATRRTVFRSVVKANNINGTNAIMTLCSRNNSST